MTSFKKEIIIERTNFLTGEVIFRTVDIKDTETGKSIRKREMYPNNPAKRKALEKSRGSWLGRFTKILFSLLLIIAIPLTYFFDSLGGWQDILYNITRFLAVVLVLSLIANFIQRKIYYKQIIAENPELKNIKDKLKIPLPTILILLVMIIIILGIGLVLVLKN